MYGTISNRTLFLFGTVVGAWLNIWPAVINPMGAFIFAYMLVFACLCSLAIGDLNRKEKQ
jgi:hypothetical protein